MFALSAGLLAAPCALAAPQAALADGALGLSDARQFRLAGGDCSDCPTVPQALWYFRGDTIAVPTAKGAGFDAGLSAQEDVRRWYDAHRDKGDATHAPLVWIGSPEVLGGVRLDRAGKTVREDDGSTLGFAVVPKIASNLSYYDAVSIAYFADQPLKLRGKREAAGFVARSIWPRGFDLSAANVRTAPLAPGESLSALVRADGGGAREPFAARVLWEHAPGAAQRLAGKPALAFMLNGAQGDDDEAHGGHFAIATGRFGAQGQWDDWLVNNFYNLDSISEKGIVAAMLPMDAYMADLNSGQSWYRPSYMLVAVLKDERAALLYQQGIGRVFNHFYRHDFVYRHATANCAGLSLQTLRSLGWKVPMLGPTSRLKAVAALPYMSIKDGSLESGRKAYEYLTAEQTDLYPMVAFTAAGEDLLARLATGRVAAAGLERVLADDLEALLFVRIPQFPSSRAYGQAPVASLDEYLSRVPDDRTKWKIVPVEPRPFPRDMLDPSAPGEGPTPATYALAAYAGVLGLGLIGVMRRIRRRARNKA